MAADRSPAQAGRLAGGLPWLWCGVVWWGGKGWREGGAEGRLYNIHNKIYT